MTLAITVLAGGWSASCLDLRKLPGTVIGVNDSALYAPRVDIAVSMDRLWAEARYPTMVKMGKPLWLRKSTLRNLDRLPEEILRPYECDHTSTVLSDERGHLNGTHSGFCALNLAYQMRPTEIYLAGFDMHRGPRGEAHWFPQYHWVNKAHATSVGRLAEWAGQFAGAARQCLEAGISVYLIRGSAAVPPIAGFSVIDRKQMEAQCSIAA
jgi:hypothetical protein